MGDFINEIGNKYGELIVIGRGQDYIKPSGVKEIRWICKCSCGNEILISGYSLRNRKLATCGHYNDIHIGDKFGHLTVIAESERYYYPNSKKILYNNEYYSIAEIARATGISKSLLYKRNNDGVPLINKNDTIKGIYFVNEFGNVINDPID